MKQTELFFELPKFLFTFMMNNTASYILSAYSFITDLPLHELLEVGHKEKDGHPIPSFSEDMLINICKSAQDIFKNESSLLKIEGDLIVVGDIHGSFHDLLRILKYVEQKKEKVLFIGDFVDRGNFSLECITVLFSLKILRPDNYFLIRGNHEFETLCNTYGFKSEILNKKEEIFFFEDDENKNENVEEYHTNKNCYEYTEMLYNAFIRAFSYLPLAAIVNDTTFCVHGGLSPLLKKVELLNVIKRPITSFEENMIITDLLWSDPSSKSLTPYRQNYRGCGFLFNEKAVKNFLEKNNLKRIVRGHQCVKNGICEHFNKKCITVFSASSYSCDLGNYSAVFRICKSDDSVEYKTFPPLHRLDKKNALYYKFVQQKSCYFSMRSRNSLFKGKTKNSKKSLIENASKSLMKNKRDFNGLKYHCHVSPALAINSGRKSAFPFILVQSKNDEIKGINHSSSLPNNLLIIKKNDSLVEQISNK